MICRFELIHEFLTLVRFQFDRRLQRLLLTIVAIQVLDDLHSSKGLAEVGLAVSLTIKGGATSL